MNFISLPASDLNQPLIGVGTQLVKNYFNTARRNAPCIIFIDEIDSLSPRDKNMGYTAHLNQLLTEMDGFTESEEIIVIGASNLEEGIDGALKRSGRFDLKIHIPLPWKTSREALIRYFCERQKVGVDFDVEVLAKKTAGFSPADLKSLINLAKLNSIQTEKFYDKSRRRVEFQVAEVLRFSNLLREEKILKLEEEKEALLFKNEANKKEFEDQPKKKDKKILEKGRAPIRLMQRNQDSRKENGESGQKAGNLSEEEEQKVRSRDTAKFPEKGNGDLRGHPGRAKCVGGLRSNKVRNPVEIPEAHFEVA